MAGVATRSQIPIHEPGYLLAPRSNQAVGWESRRSTGVTRAPKRSLVEHRHQQSSRRNASTKCEESRANSEQSTIAFSDPRKSASIPIPGRALSESSSVSSTASDGVLLPDNQAPTVISVHKRPRPGYIKKAESSTGASYSPESLHSSSAPPVFLRQKSGTPPSLALESIYTTSSADRPRELNCRVCLLDKQKLKHLLDQELQYHPNNSFLYYVNPVVEDKVNATLRNEAIQSLRFMHNAFFNLCSDTFCKAVNLIDRFIVKVKVKPKYMSCVATASYCIASKLCSDILEADRPAPETLVHIARCGGNAADLLRMEEILTAKLSNDLDGVNALDFLRLFTNCTVAAAEARDDARLKSSSCDPNDEAVTGEELEEDRAQFSFKDVEAFDTRYEVALNKVVNLTAAEEDDESENPCVNRLRKLWNRLTYRMEIALCSVEVYRFRPACLALGILSQAGVGGLEPIAQLCQIDWSDVRCCANLVGELYEVYYRDPLPCSRRSLVWNLPKRTLYRIGCASPTPLDTISEDCELPEEDEWLLPLLFEP